MNLREACRMGLLCGLQTMGEAWMNVYLHGTNLFSYAELDSILPVLGQEFYQYDPTVRILDVFPDLEAEIMKEEQENNWYDQQIEKEFEINHREEFI